MPDIPHDGNAQRAYSISDLLQQHQTDVPMSTINNVDSSSSHPMDTTDTINESEPSSTPAGPVARSLAIPIFPQGSLPSSSSSASTPSKRPKFTAGSTPPSGSSAIEMLMNASGNGSSTSPAHMSPGTYYRKNALATNPSLSSITSSGSASSPVSSPASLSKRRNSNTPSLSLSPGQGPAASHLASAATAPPAATLSARKPPAYPGPSTPSMSGRPGPTTSMTPTGHKVPSPSGSLASTPPGTPVLPVPRSLLPTNPLTPALAPDRSVTVSTSRGPRIVRAKDMREHMDMAEEVVLPPQAVSSGGKHRGRSMVESTAATTTAPTTSSTTIIQTAPIVPIVPVKHLVKLSSLSSLSSLIAPATSPTASPSPPSAGSANMHDSPSPTLSSRPTPSPSVPPPPTFIILDIDETIHVNAHSPCLMMCEKGLEMYQKIISGHSNYRNVSYGHKSGLTKILQAALQSKRTVEPQTSDLLNQLQASNIGMAGATPSNNIKIFGLTARFSHMAATTRKELLKLNIDLEKSSPFPMTVRKRVALANGWTGTGGSPQQSPQDRSLTPSPVLSAAVAPLLGSSPMATLTLPSTGSIHASSPSNETYYPDVAWTDHPSHGTEAKYSQGVIYTNACEKGPVLARFLSFLWQKIEEDNAEILEQHETAKKNALAIAQAQAADEDGNPSGQSMMSISHAVSSPMNIGGAANKNRSFGSPVESPISSVTPSPTDNSSTLSLLAAASKTVLTNSRAGSASKKRLDSRLSNLPSPELGSPNSADSDSPTNFNNAMIPAVAPLNHLPTRVIFIDDRLQNCFSVYESLSSQSLFDRFYNGSIRHHVPSACEIYTCHYVPEQLNHPTNQTKADAAASGEQGVDIELIECQIHHFLTHGEILSDPKGREMLERIKGGDAAAKERERIEKERVAAAAAAALAQQQLQRSVPMSVSSSASVSPDDAMEDIPSSTVIVSSVDSHGSDDVVMGSQTPRHHPHTAGQQPVAVK